MLKCISEFTVRKGGKVIKTLTAKYIFISESVREQKSIFFIYLTVHCESNFLSKEH